jgi:hypothetical protein
MMRMATAQTEIIDLSPEEYEAFLAREVERGTGLDLATFIHAYGEGELDEADPEVARLVALLALGQNAA